MELVLTNQEFEPLPLRVKHIQKRTSCGILNTSYKSIAQSNFSHLNDNHIFSVKTRLKSERLRRAIPTPDALIKLALFLAVLAVAV